MTMLAPLMRSEFAWATLYLLVIVVACRSKTPATADHAQEESARFVATAKDQLITQELYDSTPILPPIPAGDPPSDDEVLRALEEIDPVQGNIPLLYEAQRNNVRIVKEKMSDFVDPPRIYPLIGPAQLHHWRWKCTVFYTRVLRPGWPLPQHNKPDESSEVIYIDHSHLQMVGNVNTDTPTPGDRGGRG